MHYPNDAAPGNRATYTAVHESLDFRIFLRLREIGGFQGDIEKDIRNDTLKDNQLDIEKAIQKENQDNQSRSRNPSIDEQ